MAHIINNYILINNIEIDYMQEQIFYNLIFTIILLWYLNLLIKCPILIMDKFNKLNDKNYYNLVSYSQNNIKLVISKYTNIQSADNFKGISETIRQSFLLIQSYNQNKLYSTYVDNKLNNNNKLIIDYKFLNWLAGILDGDGYFQIKTINNKEVLKTIEIKLHNRDIRILNTILNKLHIGRIYIYKNKPYSKYIISDINNMLYLINNINGLIRLKTNYIKRICDIYNIKYIEPNFNIEPNNSYLAGLIDTDGSIVFNYTSNRIECVLEFKYNEYTSKLNLNNVIPNIKPYHTIRIRKIKDKEYKTIIFKYQNVNHMVFIYNYFMLNRLYCNFKFYRVSKILKFIEIRSFKNSSFDSPEYLIYSDFLIDWIKYENPKWYKTPFIKKLKWRNSPQNI